MDHYNRRLHFQQICFLYVTLKPQSSISQRGPRWLCGSAVALFQRDHEDLLREAEQQQERSKKTIEELNASVTTLTGRLREQEEAFSSCKVNTLSRTHYTRHLLKFGVDKAPFF